MANLGLYHPVHNTEGSKRASDNKYWYNTAIEFNSTADCFNPSKLLANSGTIASGGSGRSDQYEYYDAIYAGQVHDLRLSANKQDTSRLLEDSIRRDVAGETRGKGSLVYTYPHGTETLLSPEFDEIPQVAFVGSATAFDAAFPNGCVGKYIGDEAGAPTEYELTGMKSNGSSATVVMGDGTTWSSSNVSINTTKNSITLNVPIGSVALIYFNQLSNFTEASDNGVVYGEVGGVVVSSSSGIGRGNRLHPSLTDTVGRSTATNGFARYLAVKGFTTNTNKPMELEIYPNQQPKHETHVPASQNNSDAVKSLYHLTVKDGLIYPMYHATQLIYDATAGNWGDTYAATETSNAYGVVDIVSGESTKTDLNGNTVRVVTHIGKYPLGIADYTESSSSTD